MDTTTTNPKKTYHLSATVPWNASEKTSSCEWLRSGFVQSPLILLCHAHQTCSMFHEVEDSFLFVLSLL
jgi:hypothetical protein